MKRKRIKIKPKSKHKPTETISYGGKVGIPKGGKNKPSNKKNKKDGKDTE